jgi:uncharacterized protein YndB with AHSA1/START domain
VVAEPVVVRLHIDAPREVVFDCFCDPSALVTWMGDWADLEPTRGGTFAVDIDDMAVRGEFKVVERPSRLVFSWGVAGSDVPPGASTVEVVLAEDRGGTQLTLTHSDLPDVEVRRHAIGWNRFLPRLAAVAAEPATRFTALVDAFAGDPAVTPPEIGAGAGRKFGSNALKVNNKIFAMLRQDRLVVKLPGARVEALIGAGHGERMISGGGRTMKEWLVLDKRSDADWTALAREAYEFVEGQA